MIIDNIKNASRYYALGQGIESGLRFLQDQDTASLALGRYEIDGDNCFAMVQEYQTKPEENGVWEAHKRYIDIQYVASGVENIGYTNIDNLTVSRDYDETADVMFLRGCGDLIELKAGSFAILAPQDAHMPQIAVQKPALVKKVVVKARVI
ncbi:MAG: YhcH/YjgK/YiaL family protein [Armatimonadota bacterium]|nr:YhcH/YjgK/YiaL family protein [bacterium]